ncbi:MAG: hypothetical protein WD423_04990 [Rhodothermales bacterium]
MFDENAQIAWNAAYWLLRSEAKRQLHALYPDCDWPLVEEHDECVNTVIEAQVRICRRAMSGPNSVAKRYT